MAGSLLGQVLENSQVILISAALVIAFVIKEMARKPKYRNRRSAYRANSRNSSSDYAAEQLKIVSQAEFSAAPLLNRPEAAVFAALDAAVSDRNSSWQVMAQVSLGEFLRSKNKEAHRAINSKRVDFALMDNKACVVHVIEYNGTGHHVGKSAAARDAVKKEALRKAGIGYHEILGGQTTPNELRVLVNKLVPRAAVQFTPKRQDAQAA